jgi:hypothetical protein
MRKTVRNGTGLRLDAGVPARNENKKVLQEVGIVRGCRGVFEPESDGSEKKRKGGSSTIERIVTPRQRKRNQEEVPRSRTGGKKGTGEEGPQGTSPPPRKREPHRSEDAEK